MSTANMDHVWHRSQLIWEVVFAAVLAGTCMVIASGDRPAPSAKSIAIALLAGQVAAYIGLGRTVIPHRDAAGTRAIRYVLLMIALFVPAAAIASSSALALTALVPLCFMALRPLRAIVAGIALEAVPLLGILVDATDGGSDLTIIVAVAVVCLAASCGMGVWIYRIVLQSRERADLIKALNETRDELATAHRRAGMLAERERQSQEIHDTLAQGFAGIILLLRNVEEAGGSARRDEAVRLARTTAEENLVQARAYLAGALDHEPLPRALREIAVRLGDELEIPVDYRIYGKARALPTGSALAILRAAQEGVANVRKHANATAAGLTLTFEPSAVRLTLVDDGTGFDPGNDENGYGLRGIRRRVAELNGEVLISGTGGTTLRVEIPT